jgi:4-diphosphocytidyl-2-C-methyl-D-erythritol kinase
MTIECRSYAKINWTLDVLGKRDDGYHELRTILQTIDLHDSLYLETTSGPVEISCDNPAVPLDERNLIYQAADHLRKKKGVRAGVRAELLKRIPMGGGLGGGSSNAAVMLLALHQLWDVPFSVKETLELAASLGADVPFFLFGGTAVGVGRGSEVFPLPEIMAHHLLLVIPPIEVSTREVYAAVGKPWRLTSEPLRANIPGSCAVVFRACDPPILTVGRCGWDDDASNDLEAVVVAQYPEVRRIIERLRQLGAKPVRMSGSGSTVYAVFERPELVDSAETELASEPWQVVRTRTVGRTEYWDTLVHTL